MCQITIDDKEIFYTISNIKLVKSNGKTASSFSIAYKDFIKLYLEVNVSDAGYVPPNVFQPYYELWVNGELSQADTFVNRYTPIDEQSSSCLIRVGTAGEHFTDGNYELTIKVFDTPAERKPDFVSSVMFNIEP